LAVDGHTHYTDVWVLDSGASYHICPRREWFSTYEQLEGGNIAMGNCNALFIYLIILLENIVYYYILYDFW